MNSAALLQQGCQSDKHLVRDLKTLVQFVEVYCHEHHQSAAQSPVAMKTHNVQELMGKTVELCPECARLLTHALVKRSVCPMAPKPACRHCPSHCYHPAYRRQIREVMKYSGRKLVLSGRIDLLRHLLF